MAVMVVTGGPSPDPPGVGDWSARPPLSWGGFHSVDMPHRHTHTDPACVVLGGGVLAGERAVRVPGGGFVAVGAWVPGVRVLKVKFLQKKIA